ncbi:odorant receptor 10-like [Halictus rubicundus]|uniref:odorant receptor 10-like n=1 Tax=Halictus rubicundus TaxID=77578 RepID=UPI0040351462
MKSSSTVSKSVRFGLHFIGIWPGTPFPGLHKILWVIAMVLFQGYQYKSIISRCRTDSLVSLIDSLSIVLPITLVSIKLTVSWIHHDVLCKLLSTMEEDCEKYAAIDTHKLIPKAADLSYRLTTITAVLYPLSAGFYAVGTFVTQQSNDSTTRQLVLVMDLPFDTNESPVYELVVTTQFLFLTSSAFTFGIFSALLLMMTLHLGCHVDVLCHTLSDSSEIGNKQIRFFISRQQEIVLFAERIEQLFTYIALSQLFSNTLITCCLGYLIVITLNTENGLPMLIKSVLFYYVICLEAFIYCFAGEYLDIKSKMIGNAAYESLWYNMQPINSRQLVLLILRAQKGLPLTFGKFSNLNLESFTSIMKASASYMSVLLAMS